MGSLLMAHILSGEWVRHISTTCEVDIEDCEGSWLSGCRSSVAEHWLHKLCILDSISGDCRPFHFPLFLPQSIFIPTWSNNCKHFVAFHSFIHSFFHYYNYIFSFHLGCNSILLFFSDLMVPFDLYIQQHALMVTSDFEVVQTVLKVEWKFATIMYGALCVMTCGIHLMQGLHADSLDFHQ